MTGQNPNIRAHAAAGDWGGHSDWQFWQNDVRRVKEIVEGMKPTAVDNAADAYRGVAERMEATVRLIYTQSRRLAENWGGEDADAAMKQLQKAYDQAYQIHDKSRQTSSALTEHAKMQRSWKDATDGWAMDVMSSNLVSLSPTAAMFNNDQADEMMDELQRQTVESNNNFPAGIPAKMPDAGVTGIDQGGDDRRGGTGGIPPMPDTGGTGPGKIPTGPGDLPHGPGNIPGGRTDTQLPGGGSGGTDLAGYNPPGGGLGGGLGAGGSLGAGGAGTGGLGSAGAGAGGLGAGAGGFAGGIPGGGLMGKGGAAGAGGMPMGAGGGRGGGGDEEEHERATWLAEDEDVWGGDDDAAPPVIG